MATARLPLPRLQLPAGKARMWLLPLVVAVVARFEPGRIVLGIQLLVAVGLVSIVAKWPKSALLVLVALLPFQELALAAADRIGLPEVMVRDLGLWKEAVVAGCLVAALRVMRRQRRPLDAVDVLCLIYLGIVGLYYLLPRLFVHASGLSATGPPTDFTTLSTALRNDVVFVVLLLAARRLPVDANYRRRFVATVGTVGTVVAAIGVFEFLFSNAWNHFIVSTLQVPHYLATILDVSTHNPEDIRVYSQVAGRNLLRVGSVFLNQISCGFYLVIALAVGLERVVRGDRRLVIFLTTSLIGVAILLTQTRAAIVAAVVVVVCTLRPSAERRGPARARYTFMMAAGLLAVVPLTIATGLAARTSATVGGEESTHLHIDRTRAAIRALTAAPLGRGLGTGATNGTRFLVATTLTSENYYLQVGNETGAVSMAVFIALVVVLSRRMRRLALERTDILAASWRGLFLGLSVAALFLQVWLDFALAWTVWAGLGLCIGPPGGQGASTAPEGSQDRRSTAEVRRQLSAVTQQWPLILVTVLAALVTTTQLVPTHRRYTARSTLVIGLRQFLEAPARRANPYDALTYGLDRQRQVYAAVVVRGSIAADAVRRTGVARAPAAVAAETTVFAPPATQLLRIAVTDADPVVARSLANGLAEALIENAPTLQQPNGLANGSTVVYSISISDPAVIPRNPRPDGATADSVEAAILALLAALCLVTLIETLDVTIDDATDIEQALDLPVLATVDRPTAGDAGSPVPWPRG